MAFSRTTLLLEATAFCGMEGDLVGVGFVEGEDAAAGGGGGDASSDILSSNDIPRVIEGWKLG